VRCCCCAHCRCPWPCCCTQSWSTATWPLMVWPRQQWLLLALRWCSCLHCTGIIASIELFSLLALCRRHCRVGLQKASRCSAGICRSCAGILARIALASLPALHCCHCCQRCAGIVALSALASCPHCAPLAVVFALLQSMPYVASSPYPVLLTPVLLFLSSA
jgi:hypothetical protein